MTDEHPNERLVTPSEGGEGFDRSLVSRRSMLGGSALLAGLLAYTSDPTDPQLPGRASGSAAGIARASDNPDEPLIILGPESDPVGYLFQDTAGGIILQDATSGNHFWYNQSQGRWETDAELDAPALTTDQATINQVAAFIHQASNQTIGTGSITTVAFGTNNFSHDDILTVDLANNKITTDVAGVWEATLVATFNGSADWSSGDLVAGRVKFGSDLRANVREIHPGENTRQSVVVTGVADVGANTDITAEVFQNTGGDETLQADQSSTNLQVRRLG